MKKYLIAAGVASLLIAAQAMASDAAGLVGARETAAAPAETASAPTAVVRAYSNAPARPLMVAVEAEAGSASSLAAPVAVEGTPSGMIAAVSRVPDRVTPSYNASLNASTTQEGKCYTTTKKSGLREMTPEELAAGIPEECQARRVEAAERQNILRTTSGFVAAGAIAAVVNANDDQESEG